MELGQYVVANVSYVSAFWWILQHGFYLHGIELSTTRKRENKNKLSILGHRQMEIF